MYQVFLNENDANNSQNPVFIDGVQNWTTGANGQVAIPIITPGTYYVREITPPAGFQLPRPSQAPVRVVPGPSSTVAPVQNYVEFLHDQVPAFALPSPVVTVPCGSPSAVRGSSRSPSGPASSLHAVVPPRHSQARNVAP